MSYNMLRFVILSDWSSKYFYGIVITINSIMSRNKLKVAIPLLFALLLYSTAFAQQKKFIAPPIADKMENPFKGNAKAAAEGKLLYTNLCIACHGEKGKGDGIASAGLTKPPADHTSDLVQKQSDGAIFWKTFTGNNPMPSFKSLPQEQIWKLVTYIRTLAKKPKK